MWFLYVGLLNFFEIPVFLIDGYLNLNTTQ